MTHTGVRNAPLLHQPVAIEPVAVARASTLEQARTVAVQRPAQRRRRSPGPCQSPLGQRFDLDALPTLQPVVAPQRLLERLLPDIGRGKRLRQQCQRTQRPDALQKSAPVHVSAAGC